MYSLNNDVESKSKRERREKRRKGAEGEREGQRERDSLMTQKICVINPEDR